MMTYAVSNNDDATRNEEATMVPATMDAITQYEYGEASEVLGFERIAVPEPGADQVLVRVDAAGLDQGTWHLVAGLPHVVRLAGFGVRRPKNPVPGLDFAGEVVAIGSGVTGYTVGERVFGTSKGSFAQYAVADVERIAPMPAGVRPEQAAVVAVSGLTGLQGIRDVAGVVAGEKVLVIGASGGVGSYAVQVARALGAEVTGVASTSKLDFVRSLGADHVIDYTAGPIGDFGGGYDVILDMGGNRTLRELRRLLVPNGRLVITGGENGGSLVGGADRQIRASIWSLFSSKKMKTFISSENSEDLRTLAAMVERGELRIPLDRVVALPEAAGAIDDMRAGRVRGKLAVVPEADPGEPAQDQP
ncbi:MAG: NAD(P)-dependent alcohol dehydrogenase [Microthrixaceae bacterium]|nr:NAD(P)-dependent alcohol dehydrogenase [Microthrixaceae bacterium]